MNGRKIEDLILAELEKGAAREGLDIVSVEVTGPASHPTLRIRLDLDGDDAIDMDRVTKATPWVSSVVEALDPFPGAYELEVSSPGIDRPLRRPRDFAAFVGENAEVAVREAVEGRRSLEGEIVSADEASVRLRTAAGEVEVPFENVKSARLKPDFARILAEAKKAEKAARAAGAADGAVIDPDSDDEDDDGSEDDVE